MLKATLDLIVKEFVDVLMSMKHVTELLDAVRANRDILEIAVRSVSIAIL